MKNLVEDLNAFTKNGELLDKIKCIITSHSFHLVFLYRLGCFLSNIKIIGALIRIVFEYGIRIIFSSDISLRSRIGPGLVIVHGHDIVIGGNVVIGKRCKILNGVTLGNKDTENEMNYQPILGDNIVIGSGAKILGDISIGNNVTIGANSVITKNVSNNCVVAGIPARVINYRD